MKTHLLPALSAMVLLLCLSSCHKDDIASFQIVKETITVAPNSATIDGSYSYQGTIKSIVAEVTEKATDANVGAFPASLEGTDFVLKINGLKEATEYAYRYAVDYGASKLFKTEIKTFVTKGSLPIVKTLEITLLDNKNSLVSCEVVSDGGTEVTARGICWNTQGDPSMNDKVVSHPDGGTGQFAIRMENLDQNTTYFVRAYAANSAGSTYGNEMRFTTLPQGTPPGAVDGLFSVGGDKRVWFSQGNLQYQASTDTWRFADYQTQCLGDKNNSVSSTYDGWIDLFGWGTSGFDHGAVCYQPWSISQESTYYYAYGQWEENLFDQSGLADWGCNPISNGGNVTKMWRTLTSGEWEFVFYRRSTLTGIRFAKAVVNDVNGVLLFPDDWQSDSFVLNSPDQGGADYTSNVVTAGQWADLEEAGVVFLPAGGGRSGNSVHGVGTHGCYWSSSSAVSVGVRSLNFLVNDLSTDYIYVRYMGNAVRLVSALSAP